MWAPHGNGAARPKHHHKAFQDLLYHGETWRDMATVRPNLLDYTAVVSRPEMILQRIMQANFFLRTLVVSYGSTWEVLAAV